MHGMFSISVSYLFRGFPWISKLTSICTYFVNPSVYQWHRFYAVFHLVCVSSEFPCFAYLFSLRSNSLHRESVCKERWEAKDSMFTFMLIFFWLSKTFSSTSSWKIRSSKASQLVLGQLGSNKINFESWIFMKVTLVSHCRLVRSIQ